jgi:cell division protein FtsN
MPRNDDGEFELIMGNRQLLSVFFIVVILLGVFFTMGYIVGRNSSPFSAADSHRQSDGKAMVVDSASRPAPTGSGTPDDSRAAAAAPPANPPTVEQAKPEPGREPAKPEKAPESASPTPDQPSPGQTYLQVAAVQRAEAELFVDVLAKKGPHAVYAPVPDKPQTFRVLVGPFKDASSIAQARTDLQKAGFKGFEALVRKY